MLKKIISTVLLASAFAAPVTTFAQSSAPAASIISQRNLAQEEQNRQLVLKFYDAVFNQHDLKIAPYQYLDENLIQHNPAVPNGRAGFVNRLKPLFEQYPERGSRFIRSAAEGDLVWVHVHSTQNKNDRGRAIMDIFRVKDGKIVEHWDVVQPIPETSANENGMF